MRWLGAVAGGARRGGAGGKAFIYCLGGSLSERRPQLRETVPLKMAAFSSALVWRLSLHCTLSGGFYCASLFGGTAFELSGMILRSRDFSLRVSLRAHRE